MDLRAWKVSEIFIAGLFAEACVKATTVDGLKNNYKVTVITDTLGSKTAKNLKKSLAYYQSKKATLIPANMIQVNKNQRTA